MKKSLIVNQFVMGLYNTNFHGNKMPKENEHYTCLSVILLDSVFVNPHNEYYPQVFLKNAKMR